MNLYTQLRNIMFPLDRSLEKAYRDHQLIAVSAPLRVATVIASIILWFVVFGSKRLAPHRPILIFPALIMQLWLAFMFITINRTGIVRNIAIYTTPLFPALVAFFLAKYVIVYLPTHELMEQAYAILCVLIFAFYGLETVYASLAIFAGLLTSFVILYFRMTNPVLEPNEAQILRAHVFIANAIGLAMCINLRHVCRQQFKNSKKAEKEKEVSDRLIKRVFPESIGHELRTKGSNLARSYQNVTVLIADIANFTRITTTMDPKKLVSTLHELFSAFDRIAEQHGVEKIKTIGDAYMATAGCPKMASDHAQRIAYFAQGLLEILDEFNQRNGFHFEMRIGIHTGPVIGGVISGKRISFDIWGETVNLASRLQNSAEPGEILTSDTTVKLLRGDFLISEFRLADFKGIGPTPVARIKSATKSNPYAQQKSQQTKSDHVNEIAFLSQH